MTNLIDINCDLGEGAKNDAQLMPHISSCNIACGGHYGNEKSMINTIRLAKRNAVRIGAHPSFPDRENFGRREIKIDDEELQESIYDQVINFKRICEIEDVELNHIKLHGALYSLAANSPKMAKLIFESLAKTNLNCKLYTPYQSELTKVNQSQFQIYLEAFIDRAYHSDLTLVNRSIENALISDPETAWQQLKNIVQHNNVISVEGKKTTIIADTYCIHGDSEGAVEIIKYISQKMRTNQIEVK